ncbi:Uncharacterised protein [Chlamydia abortus]|nr:Uncharacterised protein [Chlamydia abortus]
MPIGILFFKELNNFYMVKKAPNGASSKMNNPVLKVAFYAN